MIKALKKVGDFLGSIHAAIILLIIISVVSLFGVVVPQGLPREQYLHKWGVWAGSVLLDAGIDHVFSTVWFYLLLGLFSCNILFCSSTRLWKTATNSHRKRFLSSRKAFDQFKNTGSFSSKKLGPAAADAVMAFLKKHGYGIKMRRENSSVQIAATKGLLKDIGSLVFHISIIVLLIGGLVGSRNGYSIVKQLGKGQIVRVPDRPFLLRCDWFKLERTDEGAVKEYLSKLTLLSADSAVLAEKTIQVNNPLTYQGIRFYQSSYGEDPGRAADVALRISGPDLTGEFNGTVPYDSDYTLPKTDLTVRVTQFIPDFIIDMESGQVSSRSDEPNNPAVRVMLFRGKDTLFNHWAFFKFPEQHEKNEPYKVITQWYDPSYYTGIQIRRNPGEPVIWFGIICMTLGILGVFYVSRQSLWVQIDQPASGPSEIALCLTSSKAASESQRDFEKISHSLQEILG